MREAAAGAAAVGQARWRTEGDARSATAHLGDGGVRSDAGGAVRVRARIVLLVARRRVVGRGGSVEDNLRPRAGSMERDEAGAAAAERQGESHGSSGKRTGWTAL